MCVCVCVCVRWLTGHKNSFPFHVCVCVCVCVWGGYCLFLFVCFIVVLGFYHEQLSLLLSLIAFISRYSPHPCFFSTFSAFYWLKFFAPPPPLPPALTPHIASNDIHTHIVKRPFFLSVVESCQTSSVDVHFVYFVCRGRQRFCNSESCRVAAPFQK